MRKLEPVLVAGVLVRQAEEGLYSVNDLHRANGGERRHEPANWLNSPQTQLLVDTLSTTGRPVVTINGGRNRGTYVCEDLLTAYAMWLNPVFYLQVVQAFRMLTRGQLLEAHNHATRDIVRYEYRAMNGVLLNVRQKQGKDTSFFHYCNEADLVNRITLGMTSAEFKQRHGLAEDAAIRDVMTPAQLEAIYGLQRANTVFIDEGQDFQSRKERLISLFNTRYLEAMIEEDTVETETLTLKVVA